MSRRCLICANINPCREHSGSAQDAELRRNMSAIRRLASADTHAKRGDAKQAPSARMGSAVGDSRDAQTPVVEKRRDGV